MKFLLAFVAGLVFQTIAPEAIRHAQAGLKAEKEGRLTDAIAEFKQVTQLAPGLPAGFVNLGAAYIQARNYAAAIPPLERAVSMNENLVGAHQMLGYALLMQGDAANAVPHLQRAQARALLGIAEVKLGRFPQAIADLNAALAKDPQQPELLYYLGRASGLLSKEAMDTLESAFPNSARSHQALGENYAALRQISKAEQEYQEAIRLDPDVRGVHLELGALYATVPDWPKAEEQFRAEAQLEPNDAETAYRLGQALLQEGKIAEAKAELECANRLRPDMPQTLYALGKVQSLSGENTAAENSWKRVIAIEKTSPLAAQAHFALATLYRKQGRTVDAARELSIYERLQKQN